MSKPADRCFTPTPLVVYLPAAAIGVHYPTQEGPERQVRDDRIWEYHVFHSHPVFALEDGAYLRVSGNQTELVKGNCWRFEPDQERTRVDVGIIS